MLHLHLEYMLNKNIGNNFGVFLLKHFSGIYCEKLVLPPRY